MHIKHMHEMIEKLTDCTKTAMEEGKTCVGEYPIGDCVDMIKDLNEAEYYAHIVKAMKEAKEEEEEDEKAELREMRDMHRMGSNDRMGYDRWRYKNGRFAPKGSGRRMGYEPMMHMPYWGDDMYGYEDMMRDDHGRMGYTANRNGSRMGDGRDGRMESRGGNENYGYGDGRREESSRYGRSYDNYKNAKRHYTETSDPEAQRKMKSEIAEIFDDMELIAVDVAKDLTPEEKQKYKVKLQQMVQKIQ